MGTKIVSVTIERHYSKQATIEIKVNENLINEELQTFLTNDDVINDLLKDALFNARLIVDDTIYEYQDPTNNDGGHL
jgi:hypothetical protein